MSKRIPRYDEDFFNCFMGHALSYLKLMEFPVELLFYNCLVNTEQIYDSFIVQERDRWHFPTPFIELSILGAYYTARPFPSFEEAKPEIQRLVDQGKVVFFIGDGYYIPHRVESYRKFSQDHNFMITGYRTTETGTHWFVEDHARPDFYDYYDEALIRDCYDLADYPNAHQIVYFEFDLDKSRNPDRQKIEEQFTACIATYTDDLGMFQRVLHNFTIHQTDLTEMPGGNLGTERALFYLASSRELFRRFVVTFPIEGELASLLKQSIDLAFRVRAIIFRGRARQVDLPKLEITLEQLKETEAQILACLSPWTKKISAS